MKAHNVLEIINLYSSASNFIGDQFTYLREHGYNMYLICSDHPNLQAFALKHQIKYKPIYLDRQLSIKKDIYAFFQICKYIKENSIDTVICHQAKARLLGTAAAFVMKVPNRIIFAHGVLYETMHGPKRFVLKTMDKIVAAMAHKVVCVSKSVASVRTTDHINNPKKNFLLNKGTCGGIDTKRLFNPSKYTPQFIMNIKNRLAIAEDDFVVGFCGRLVRDKGIIELVNGFKLLQSKMPNRHIKLLIIGEKETRDTIPETILQVLMSDKDIIFTGYIPHDDIGAYYMLMDVIALPSFREGFGMVTIEAAAMGVPAIVSRSTGCIDSIKEWETGVYTDINPSGIAESIKLFLNKDFCLKISKKCREYVITNYDHSVVWPHIIEVIEK